MACVAEVANGPRARWIMIHREICWLMETGDNAKCATPLCETPTMPDTTGQIDYRTESQNIKMF